MKKFLLIIGLVLVVTFTILGCEQGDVDTPVADPPETMDGTFVGYSEESRGFTKAEVVIEDSKIVGVTLKEFDNRGLVKDVDFEYLNEGRIESWGERVDNSEEFFEEFESHAAMTEELERRFVETNAADIDGITGATSTSDQAIEAVEMALAKAEGETLFDGRFMGISDDDSRSWGIAIVEVEDGNIVDVELEEVAKDDPYGLKRDSDLKDEEYSYEEFHEAKEEMPGRFVGANGPEVDIYTGATGSSEQWKQAVARALAKAGVYERTVGASEESRGFTKADIILDGDEFVNIGLTEYTNDGLRKDVDFEYLDEGRIESWSERIDVDLFEEYDSHGAMVSELENRFLESSSSDVDGITGATSTSDQAKEAVANALSEGPFDGIFMGISPINMRDTWGIAIVTFEDSNIVEVELNEARLDNEGEVEVKDEDYDWDEFHEAKEEMPERFINANGSEVDIYTGATGSSNLWMAAVRDAMNNAKIEAKVSEIPQEIEETEEEAEEVTDEESFTGSGEGFKSTIEVKVTMVGDEIVNVEVLNQDETPSYWEDGVKTVDDILEAGSTDVDTETGATASSEGIVEAVNDAVGHIIN
ncbi:FMN-binding protein [Natranaerofaba carboxydovora]|uniref:FMN-binding protein n=1 Tax=Natranaerofaba carboxydovora TaxID=2742683 RepID=UPI001F1313A2|nr:FMN-binding protein [Natranaerofaba carboxydovora]UMZ74596.1 FMN-binding domain protein [Natranaerofaba carboxydovora]